MDEIQLPDDQLAMPETKHETVFLRAVSSYSATYVRLMMRQAASDRKDTFQKFG